ncbi:MAG: mannosyltransferase family protein [Desulfotomaculaceae bacterium]|nr:mannosyltransferase family protein [Desulfotomaculaceae bacterium]MDD4766145.1 mannosyltransferase family protein [Desulfotomaculaceae bacterium]
MIISEDIKRVSYLYFLNKFLIIFLVYITRDVLNPFLPAAVDNLHPNPLLDSLIHWDAGWFLRIAEQGYDYDSAPFFPLFPFLIRALTLLTGDYIVSGFLISNTALLVVCIYLYRLVKDDYNEEIAMTTVFALLFFPTAIFFSSIYSESLLLAFVLGSFYYARKDKFIAAAVLGALAALTRNIGAVTFFALLYYFYEANGRRLDLKKSATLLMIPASLLIFMAVLWQATGDPLAFSTSLNREYWGFRHFSYPGSGQFTNISLFFIGGNFYCLFESGMAMLFLFLVIRSFKYVKDKSFLIFLVLGFLIPFSSVVGDTPLGMPRYVIVLFPGYITLAHILHKHMLVQVYSTISIAVFSVITVLFVTGRWIS